MKTPLRQLKDTALVWAGLHWFHCTQKSCPKAYQALIRRHCETNGAFTDKLSRYVQRHTKRAPNNPVNPVSALLPAPIDRTAINAALSRDGFYMFPQRAPETVCQALKDFSYTARYHCSDPIAPIEGLQPYNPEQPIAARYEMCLKTALSNPLFQRVLADPVLYQVATDYLGVPPQIDIAAMWWSTNASQVPGEHAAQMYHFDMDRIKWLKFFLYLTDVDEASGPHVFVPTSHRPQPQNIPLYQKYYSRLTDEEVTAQYPHPRPITGPAGTMFIADTRAFHKGLLPKDKHRLVLQLCYTQNLFGGSYQQASDIQALDPNLKAWLKDAPWRTPIIQNGA